jgi:hypothetical protein
VDSTAREFGDLTKLPLRAWEVRHQFRHDVLLKMRDASSTQELIDRLSLSETRSADK